MINLAKQGYTQALVKTVDSDVAVLSFAYADCAQEYGLENLYVLYGPDEKYYNVFENSAALGFEVCKALPFFHAFTGCDTVSSFYQHGKAKFWKVWQENLEQNQTLTEVFKHLSDQPHTVDEHIFNTLCSFVYAAYGISTLEGLSFKAMRVNHLINTPDPNLRALVPSPSGILQHIKRACSQASYLWRLCEFEFILPDPVE